jgi:FdhD protein
MADPPMKGSIPGATVPTVVLEVRGEDAIRRDDAVAAEEPLEIRVVTEVGGRRRRHSVAVTMRTPGNDFELAVGFLCGEGLVRRREEIWRVGYCDSGAESEARNVVEVHLDPGVDVDLERLTRHVFTSSSCGVCGKASLEAVRVVCPRKPLGELRLEPALLLRLPAALGEAQPVFGRTGGLHAAGLFDDSGRLLELCEDVGRHNAVDKVVGALLLGDSLPAGDRILLVSGRASFELVQKAAIAGIPVLAAVGAPSSLAVELASEQGMTLIGFLRDGRFNVYAGSERMDFG